MDRSILFVGVGGAVGSIFRYLAGAWFAQRFPSAFPFGTLAVNLAGCFLIGLVFGLSERSNFIYPELRIALTAGFCGGFTTFSAFSFESVRLLQEGQVVYAALNVTLSVLLGIGATYLAIFLVRSV